MLMELSINAIVTLVIAMTVLAFGFGLLSGVLSVGTNSLSQSIDGYTIDVPATSDNQLVVASPLRLDKVGSNVVIMSFYNKGNAQCDDVANDYSIGAWTVLDCEEDIVAELQSTTLDVPVGRAVTFGMVVDRNRDVLPGVYTCTMNMYCGKKERLVYDATQLPIQDMVPVYSKPLFVEVR